MSGSLLNVYPTDLPFGDAVTGVDVDASITLENNSFTGEDIIISAGLLSSGVDFSLPGASFPFTLSVGSPQQLVVRFTPSGAGAKTDTLTLYSDAYNNPVTVALSGTGVAAGTKSLTVDPPANVFSDTKVGTTTVEFVFTIRNTGTNTVQVTALTPSGAQFALGGTSPVLPANILTGATLDFGVTFTPSAEGYRTGSFSVVSDASASPFTVELSGMGFLITPAYTVVGAPISYMWSFATALQATSVKQLESPTSFDVEEDAIIRKLQNCSGVDGGGIGVDKTHRFVYFHYEDLGEATVLLTVSNPASGASEDYEIEIGTPGAGGVVRIASHEFTVEGENIEIKFENVEGPVQIIDYLLKFMPDQEMLGTLANPTTITPAFTISAEELSVMVALASDIDAVVVNSFDEESFDTEEVASVSNTLMMPIPVEAGSLPGFVYEKTCVDVNFHYEDYGVATVRITLTSMRGQIVYQDVSIGSLAADQSVNNGIANIKVTDEIVHVAFSHVAGDGPIVIVDYTTRYVVTGERAK